MNNDLKPILKRPELPVDQASLLAQQALVNALRKVCGTGQTGVKSKFSGV